MFWEGTKGGLICSPTRTVLQDQMPWSIMPDPHFMDASRLIITVCQALVKTPPRYQFCFYCFALILCRYLWKLWIISKPIFSSKKKFLPGNSLVAQWLGLCAFIAEGPGSISDWGTKIPQAAWHSQKKKKKFSS